MYLKAATIPDAKIVEITDVHSLVAKHAAERTQIGAGTQPFFPVASNVDIIAELPLGPEEAASHENCLILFSFDAGLAQDHGTMLPNTSSHSSASARKWMN